MSQSNLRSLRVGNRQYMLSARELFPLLRRRLIESRPVVEPARQIVHIEQVTATTRKRRADKDFKPFARKKIQTVPAVYGKPMFRNVIDPETGAHI